MTHPLREFRARNEITLEDLATRVGSSKFSLSRIERGKQGMTDALLRKLVAETGLSADEILGLETAE